MDRWKDSEVEKMKVGGNSRTKEFFDSQSDITPGMSFTDKYNSRTAALYRDKVCVCVCLLRGRGGGGGGGGGELRACVYFWCMWCQLNSVYV